MKEYNSIGFKVLNIKADTHKKLKEYCTKNHIPMTSFSDEAIMEKIEREVKNNKK